MRAQKMNKLKRRMLAVVSCSMLLLFTVASQRLWAQNKDIDDQDVSTAVEMEFWKDPAVASNQINVETKEGIVMLTGSVDNILAKERAEKIAEATVGVRSVVNRIEVKPVPKRMDSELLNAVIGALAADPATESYEVHVKVDNGVITLTGTVDSWQEKQLCGIVAKGVKGVRELKNQIKVDYKVNRPDSEIENEVKERLANDVRVDDAMINVDVRDEEVILTGTVGSAQEKAQARVDAWVGGVDSVNTEDLKVEWWARDTMRRKGLYESRTDRQIEKAVKDAFIYDPHVYSFDIDVDVTAGVALLSGVVNNLKAKIAAEHDAENTIGVSYVRNNIKVRPKVIPLNKDLESRVSDALLENAYIDRFDINISASNGIIYLSGHVNTSWEKNLAERVADGVKGAVVVVNNIKYEHEWVWKPDYQIRREVKDQLWWSPFVDSDDVTVKVKNGIVTLSGTAETYSERQSAEENAYEGGAKEVVNSLRVTYPYRSPYDYGTFDTPYYYGP